VCLIKQILSFLLIFCCSDEFGDDLVGTKEKEK